MQVYNKILKRSVDVEYEIENVMILKILLTGLRISHIRSFEQDIKNGRAIVLTRKIWYLLVL